MTSSAEFWDRAAATFDDEPDHGLRDPAVRAAWRALLLDLLPPPPARVADLGCGTGSLTVLLAEAGFAATGVDSSPEMVARARRKAGETPVDFLLGDAAHPPLRASSVDVVLCRHLLWALPDPEAAVARWIELLAPGELLVAIEGRWSTGAGLPAAETERLLRAAGCTTESRRLDDPQLWGRDIADERYVTVSVAPGWPTRPRRRARNARAFARLVPPMDLDSIPLRTITGAETTFGEFGDKVRLVVNVASRCGLAPQYEKLEQLQRTYGDRGFTVLGFPSNQFLEELGSEEKIAEYCSTTWGVTFPMFERVKVNGRHRHPLYAALTETPDADGEAGKVKWNFEKFLVTRDGTVFRFRPGVEPDAPEIVERIEASLTA